MRLSQISQFLTILLAPLYIVRFYLPPISTNILEIFLVSSIGITFYYFAKEKFPFQKIRTKFDLLIGLFLLSAVISTIVSADFLGGLGILKAYFIEPVLFFYALVYEAKKSGYAYIILGLIFSGVWLSMLAVLQFFTGAYTFAPYEMALGRVSAVYNSANSLALYLGPIALLVLGLFLIFQKNYQKMLMLVLFIIFTIVVVWTKSRGGLVSEAVGLFILGFGILTLKKISFRKLWVLIPIGLMTVSVIFFYQLFLNYKSLPSDSPSQYQTGDTLQIRYKLWSNTLQLLEKNPIFGAGLNGFQTSYGRNSSQLSQDELFQYPHNIFLNFWSELGIFGLVIFAILNIKLFQLLLKNIYSHKDPILGFSLMTVFSFWIMHGMVDVPYFKNDLSLEFWIFLALTQLYLSKADYGL